MAKKALLIQHVFSAANPRKIKHFFVLGKEGMHHDESDILIVDVKESYYNLTVKTIETLKAMQNLNFNHFIKIDEDVFVNWNELIPLISNIPKSRLYYGFTWFNAPKVNSIKNKNQELNFKQDFYPPFNAGPFYILSKDVVSLLVADSFHKIKYSNEDVNIGIWLSSYNLTLIHDPLIQVHSFSCSENIIALHSCSTARLYRLHQGWIEYGKICHYESKVHPEYCLFGLECEGFNEWTQYVECHQEKCRYFIPEDVKAQNNRLAMLKEIMETDLLMLN